jgi:hypothetical protein
VAGFALASEARETTRSGSSTPPVGGAELPAILIHDPVFNWGKAFRGAQLERKFTIENVGRSPLRLEGAKPNCGCMSLKDEAEAKKTLQPGEKSTITLLIDTQILEPGLIKNKHTEIVSNAASGENRLSIEGEIEALFQLDPALPRVEVVRAHLSPTPQPTVIKLTPLAHHKVRIRSLRPQKGLLQATLAERSGASPHFEVTLLPQLKDRNAFQGDSLEADVEVDGVAIPFRIPVSIVLKDRIEVSPSPSVFFLQKDTGQAGGNQEAKPRKLLEISSIGGEAHRFRIKSVTARDQVFKAAVETIEEGKRYRLTVTLEKRPQQGERFLKDRIEVQTDDPEVPVLTIQGSARF